MIFAGTRRERSFVLACAGAIVLGAFEATQRPTVPKHAGLWIAIAVGIAGLTWSYRAVALAAIGALAWAIVGFATQTAPPNSGDSHSVVIYLLLALFFAVAFGIPAAAGALFRALLDRATRQERGHPPSP
jgi:hypothetical protein